MREEALAQGFAQEPARQRFALVMRAHFFERDLSQVLKPLAR
jgi:hypothetical protein